MACQTTPTATLFGTSVVSTFSVTTILSTEIITLPPVDGFTTVTTCSPTTIEDYESTYTSCSPTTITEPIYPSKCCIFLERAFIRYLKLPTASRLRTDGMRGCCLPSAVLPPVVTDSDHMYRPKLAYVLGEALPSSVPPPIEMLTNPQAIGLSTRVITSFQSTPVVQTITSPTQTLFTTSCAEVPPPYQDNRPNTPTIIGGAVGGAIGGLLLIGVLGCFAYRKWRVPPEPCKEDEESGKEAAKY